MKNFTRKFWVTIFLTIAFLSTSNAQSQLFYDGFESGSLTQKNWTQEFSGTNSTQWSVASNGVGTITPLEGSKMAKLYAAMYQSPVKLVTPEIDLADEKEPYMSFYMAAQKFNVGTRDTLKLYYKEQGQDWNIIRVYNIYGDSWQKKSIRIKDFTDATKVQFAFEYCYANGKGIALDSVYVWGQQTCFSPFGLKAQSMSNTSTTLRWTSSSYASNNLLKVSTTPLNIADLDNIVADTYDDATSITYRYINNLIANKKYYWYVKSICGQNDKSPWVSSSFTTRCDPIPESQLSTTIEGFEDSNSGGYPTCWLRQRLIFGDWSGTTIASTSYLPAITLEKAQGTGSTKSLKIQSFYEDKETYQSPRYVKSYAISQEYGVGNISNYQVVFYANAPSTGSRLHVGIMTDPDDIESFVEVEAVSVDEANSWEKKIVYFNNTQSLGKYVAFMVDGSENNSDNTFYIDNVWLDQIPPCPQPINFSNTGLINIGENWTATFSWRSLYSDHTYDISLYMTPVNDPDQVYPDLSMTNVKSPASVPNLKSYSKYYAYIKNHCGSPWTGPIEIKTKLAPVTIPFQENFEIKKPWVLACETQANKWVVGSATKNGGNKSLYISKNNGISYIYNTTAVSKSYAYKNFRLTGGEEIEISFMWKNWGDDANAYLKVYLAPDVKDSLSLSGQSPKSDWTPLCDVLTKSNSWKKEVLTTKVTNTGVYSLIFQWENSGGSNAADYNPPAAIDDITIRKMLCPTAKNIRAKNITENSANIIWGNSDNDAIVKWKVWVRPLSNPDTTGIQPQIVTNNSYNATNLTPMTGYRVYIVTVCNTGYGNSYDVTYDFYTRQTPQPLPFFDSFEGNNSWAIKNGTQKNRWYIGSADHNGAGSKSLYISNNNGASRAYKTSGSPDPTSYVYAYQTFDFVKSEVYGLSFDYKSSGERNKDVALVFLVPDIIQDEIEGGNANGMTDGNNRPPGEWLKLSSNPIYKSGTQSWTTFDTVFSPLTTGRYKILFVWKNNDTDGTSSGAAAIDNVKVEKRPCESPIKIDVSCENNQAIVTWLASAEATSWEVSWGTNPASLSAPTTVTTPTFTATPIVNQAGKIYYFKIKTNCQNGGTATKTYKYVLATPFPFYTGFETDDNNAWEISGSGNRWTFGSDKKAVIGGQKSLYISSSYSGVKPYSYNTNSSAKSYAYRSFNIERGIPHKIQFYWKANGEQGNDFVKVYLVPKAYDYSLDNAGFPNNTWVMVSDGELSMSETWQKVDKKITVSESGVYYLAFFWENNFYDGAQPPGAIDELKFYPSSCDMVEEIEVTNQTKTSAKITWNSIPEVASYHIKVSTTEIDPEQETGNILDDDIIDTTINLTSLLNAGTTYYVYVRTNCDANNHSYYNFIPVIFSTLCDVSSNLPYVDNINQYPINSVPQCWTAIQIKEQQFVGDYKPFVAEEIEGDSIGNRFIKFNSYFDETIGSTKSFAFVPEFTTPISQLQISFDLIGELGKKISLLTSSSNTSVSAASIIRTFEITEQPQSINLVLDSVYNNHTFIGFVASGDNNSVGTIGLDNINLSVADMCMKPTLVNHRDVSTNSVEIYWESPYMAHHDWQVVVTTQDISDDIDGLLPTLAPTAIAYNQNVRGNNVVINTLSSNVRYYYYVRQACAGGSHSDWYDHPGSFKTQCTEAQLCSLEFIMGSTVGNGWGAMTSLDIMEGDILVNTLKFQESNINIKKQVVVLCPTTYTLVFNKKNKTEYCYFKIVIDGDTVFRAMPDPNLTNRYSVEVLDGCGFFSCGNPYNAKFSNTGTTINASWEGNGSNYMVQLYKGAQKIGEQTVATPNVVFTGLNANTSYKILVKSKCNDGTNTGQSEWVTFNTRTSLVLPISPLPIQTDFENDTENNKWYFYTNSTIANKWSINNSLSSGGGSKSLCISPANNSIYSYNNNIASYAYAVRAVNLIAGNEYNVEFDWKAYGERDNDLLKAFLIPDNYGRISEGYPYNMTGSNNTPPTDWIDITGDALCISNDWQHVDTVVPITKTGNYFISFFWKNNTILGINPPAAIDNFNMYKEDCPKPQNISTNSITTTSATIQWEGAATSYDVKLYKDGPAIDPNNSTALSQSLGQTTKTYSMTGLMPNTTYVVYLKSNCSGGLMSLWQKTSFVTDFNISPLPLNTNFEDAQDNKYWIFRSNITDGEKNQWAIDTATYSSPSKSMYVTKDNGRTNSYANNKTTYLYAFRAFDLLYNSGYDFSFKWKSVGEVTHDLGRAFLIPASYKQTLNKGNSNGMENGINNAPSDWIDIGGDNTTNLLKGSTTWQSVNKYVEIPTDGQYYLAFFWKNNGNSNGNTPVAIDDVKFEEVACPRPRDLTVVPSKTSVSATWNGNSQSYTVRILDATNTPATEVISTVVNNNSYTYNSLTPLTNYILAVSATCGTNATSSEVEEAFFSIQQQDTLPINANFEDEADNYMWKFSSSGTNKWYIGTANKNGGQKGLYISSLASGNSNSYSTSSKSSSYAYRKIELKANDVYSYSFDWSCHGEKKYDMLRAVVIPESFDISTGNDFGLNGYGFNPLPAGWISLDTAQNNEHQLNLNDEWKTISTNTFTVPNDGVYYLAFFWQNDNSMGEQKPAAIDNFRFSKVKVITYSDESCVYFPYSKYGFDLPSDSTGNIGMNYFKKSIIDPQTGEYICTKLELNIIPGSEHKIERTVCKGDTVMFFGRTIKAITNNEYRYYTVASNGCDSIELLKLTVNPTYYSNKDTLINNCDLPLTVNGQYFDRNYPKGTWVVETKGKSQLGCDSIVAYAVTIYGTCTSQNIAMAKNITFTPNPINIGERLTITGSLTSEELNGLKVEVINSAGQIIETAISDKYPIVVGGFYSNGVYIIRLTTGKGDVIYGKVMVK